MSVLLLERTPVLEGLFESEMGHRSDSIDASRQTSTRGGLTLDELITGIWEGLAVHDTVQCPVCADSMTVGSGSIRDGAPVGVCLSCGTQLS